MTLSARIALGPSRLVDGLATALAIGGFFAVAATLAARSSDVASAWFGIATLAAALWLMAAVRRHRSAARHIVTVSDRLEVGIASTSARIDDGAWHLASGTVVWPAFGVVALRDDERGHTIRIPVVAAGYVEADRRALQRYLLWALRGGRDPRKSTV